MSRICILPMKGSSKRLPSKNWKVFHGQPIFSYPIATAKASGLFDRIIVSTDDTKVAEMVEPYGIEILMRPKALDQIGTQELAAYVLKQGAIPRYACVIYATSPMLTVDDLKAGWRAMVQGRAFAFAVGTDPLRDAATMYWGRAWAFLDHVPLIGPDTAMIPIPENRICDINTADDFAVAGAMFAKLHNTKKAALCAVSS